MGTTQRSFFTFCLGIGLLACGDDGSPSGGTEATSSTGGTASSSGMATTAMSASADGTTTGTTAGSVSADGTTTSTASTTDASTTDGSTSGTSDTTGTGTGGGPPNCGDGNVDFGDGEQCDDGNSTDDDGCSASCQVEVGGDCGDDVLDPGNSEECDDGNVSDGDGCSANCQLEPLGEACGDGNVDNLEVCDDTNVDNGDACNPTCNLENTTTLFAGAPGVSGLLDGTGQAARFGSWCVATVDNSYLWIGDSLNNGHAVIRRVDVSTAEVLTVAGGQQGDNDHAVGLNAEFGWIEAIATDGSTLWVADEANHKIKAVDLQAPFAVTTVAGSGNNMVTDGNGVNASFAGVRGITYYAGMLYVVDGNQAVLRSFDPQTGDVLTIAGTPGQTGSQDGTGAQARFVSPRYMTSDNSGMLYIADTNGAKIRTFNTFDSYVGTFAGDGTSGYVDDVGTSARIHRPRGMTSDGTSIYFSEFNQHTIRQGVIATASVSTNVGQHCDGGANCSGGYQEGTGTANTQLDSPVGLAFHHPSNTLFVCDSGNNVIRALK